MGGINHFPVALLQLTDDDGVTGFGECAPSSRYGENIAGGLDFFSKTRHVHPRLQGFCEDARAGLFFFADMMFYIFR